MTTAPPRAIAIPIPPRRATTIGQAAQQAISAAARPSPARPPPGVESDSVGARLASALGPPAGGEVVLVALQQLPGEADQSLDPPVGDLVVDRAVLAPGDHEPAPAEAR